VDLYELGLNIFDLISFDRIRLCDELITFLNDYIVVNVSSEQYQQLMKVIIEKYIRTETNLMKMDRNIEIISQLKLGL